MQRQDAAELATEINQSWRNGISTHVWEEELQHNYGDAERARRAIAKMRRTCRFAPVIADFHDAYTAQPATNIGGETTHCHDCGNDGWHEAPDETHNEHTYSTVKPCDHCRHGRKAIGSSTWKARHANPTSEDNAA